MHVHVPLNRVDTFRDAKSFARSLAGRLAEEHPHEVVDRRDRSARLGRVLIDWSQNDRFASVVAPYSLRVAPVPFVATPIGWDEVEDALGSRDPRALTFLPEQVSARVAAGIDPFARLREADQGLPLTHNH